MAVTSIWSISSNMDYVIDYIKNPEKTTDRPELYPEVITARKTVGDVIDYAEDGSKTDKMMFVTGINCNPDYAAEEFMNTKQLWGKEGGRLAYHGYQSFREGDGEMTAEKAHAIGVKLAEELWGDRFEVVVATHLNTGHLHNHYVVNSVSLTDGYKYRRTIADYHRMREVSDRLCREAHLHVVEIPGVSRGKNYGEWSAEKKGRYTVRGRIRDDIDYAIAASRCEQDFANMMKEMGYEFKFYSKNGTELVHPGIKPPGAKSFFRFSSLGENYEFETIRRRVIENSIVPGTPLLIEKNYRKWEPPKEEVPGLPSLYKKYCIRLYSYISKPAKREYIPMALREDIRKLDNYIEQMDFLYGSGIDSQESLAAKRQGYLHQLNELIIERRKLYAEKERATRHKDKAWLDKINGQLKPVNINIRALRKKIELCDSFFVNTEHIVDCINAPDKKPDMPKIKNPKKNLSL